MATFEGEIVAEARKKSLQEPLLNGELRRNKEVKNEESQERQENVTNFSSAGLLSLAMFSWLNPLLALGYEKHLNIEDVPLLPPHDRSREVYKTFDEIRQRLQSEHPDSAPSISQALVRTFWVSMVLTGVVKTLSVVAAFVGPYLLSDFVEFLSGRRRFRMDGYVLVFCFFIGNVVKSLGDRYYCIGIYLLSVRVRACLTATLYEKVSLGIYHLGFCAGMGLF